MNKILEWFDRNRKSIGYSVGGLNVIAGLVCFSTGSIFNGVISTLIGVSLIIDVYLMPKK